MKSKFPKAGFLSCLLFILFFNSATSQTTDLARIEYTYIPQSNSENSVSRFRAFVNYPIALGWEGSYLILGVEYRYLDLDFVDLVPFEVRTLGKFQLYRGNAAITFKMKNDWRFAAKAGAEINSNFEQSTVIQDDINFTGAVFFIRDRSGDEVETPSRLILGLNYSTNAGRPFPLPVINYYRKFHPQWSYSVGTPKTNLKYSANKKHAFQGFLTLDGFFSNIQSNLVVPNEDGSTSLARNISMTLVLGGVGYEYYFSKHFLYYVYGGHTIFNEIRLRDADRNNLYDINKDNTFYLRTGVKFKI